MIVCSICARGGSKGVPRKALRKVAGVPLIGHAIHCAKRCALVDRVIVSTDDEEIAAIARENNAEVPFIRPSELAGDDSPKWVVFRHLVTTCEAMLEKSIKILVDLDIGVPMRSPKIVDDCIHTLMSTDIDLVVTAYRSDRNPYFNMVELDSNDWAHVVKQPIRPIHNRQAALEVFSLSPAVYAMRRDVLWLYDHWSQARMRIHEIPREVAWDVDSELDLKIVEFLMEQTNQEFPR